MLDKIDQYIYDNNFFPSEELLIETEVLAQRAFVEQHAEALITAHQVLYQLNLANLANPWIYPVNHIYHPILYRVKYQLEKYWQEAGRKIQQTYLLIHNQGLLDFFGK